MSVRSGKSRSPAQESGRGRQAPGGDERRPVPIVVKLGGSLLEDAVQRGRVLDAIAAARLLGERFVIVHGGGKKIDALSARLGLPKRTSHGLRVTDAATLEVVVASLAGVVNKTLVSELRARGVAAVGICGADGATLPAERHPPVEGTGLGFVGKPDAAQPALLDLLAAGGYLPVVGSLAIGPDACLLNVNADAAAAAVAIGLGARRLVFLTDVEGVLDASGERLDSLSPDTARHLLENEVVNGGMRPKLVAALAALGAGVAEVVIAGPSRHARALQRGTGGTHLVAA